MKITTYIQSMQALFGKQSLLEDLRFARTLYTQLPDLLARADKTMGSKFKSAEMKRVQQVFTGVVKGNTKGIFGYLAANNANIIATIDAIEAISAGEFEDRIAVKGLNYKKANLIQIVDAITFTGRYTVKLLTYALKHEVEVIRTEKKLAPTDTVNSVPAELEWVNKGMLPYCQAIAIITKPAASIIDRIDQIPDILADDINYSSLKNSIGEAKIDPFLFSINNFSWNPLRNRGMHKVEAKLARAKETETELAMTKLRLLQYERSAQGKEDPAVEREIKYLQSLSEELTRELAQLSED